MGSFVPGSTVILSLSALIPAGDLNLAGVLAAAIGGALIGDGLAYWLGHRYPDRVRGIWPLNKYPEVVERSEAFFRKYGDAAVFLARFLPPVRAFVPITAGATRHDARADFFRSTSSRSCAGRPRISCRACSPARPTDTPVRSRSTSTLPIIAGIVAVGILIWAIRRWLRPSEAG